MFSAWVVLPPNDIWKMIDWPVLDFQSVAKVPDDEVSLPYASYGLLYAAIVRTGELVFLQELVPPVEPLAAEQPAATSASVAPMAAVATRERVLIRSPHSAEQLRKLVDKVDQVSGKRRRMDASCQVGRRSGVSPVLAGSMV